MTFPLLLFAYLFSQFFRSFLTIIAADLTRDLGFGPAELGWISSAWFLTFAFAQFPVGYLLDTAGPRRTLGGLMLAGVAGAAVFALSNGFWTSVIGMALIGVGCSPILMASLYIFGRTAPPERFSTLASWLVGLGGVGNLVAATPLTLAAQAFGWRISMMGVGLLMGFAAAAALTLLRDPPRATRDDGRKASALGDILAVLKMRALWFSLPLHGVSYAVLATERGLWIGPYLERVHGLDAVARGNAAFLMSLGMAAGALACGPASRLMRSVKAPAVLANAVTGCLLLTLGLAAGLGAGAATLLLVLIGFFGFSYSLMLSHGRQFFPDHLLGRGVTVLNFLAIGGAGLMQALTGAAIDAALAAGTPPAQAFASMHLALGLVLLVALALFLRAPARPAQA